MALGISFFFISQIILIPIVFSVHRTNNKVLSLFGNIPTIEIKELVAKCEKFMQKFSEERQEIKNEEG
jgi:hypothetical protein